MPGPLAISNRVQLRFKPEAAFGVVPGTGVPYALRVMSESLKYNVQTAVSQELRSDRMTADLIPVDGQAEGGTPFEVSYGEFDSILQAVMCGAWGQSAGTGGESAAITVTITLTNVVTASAGTPFSTILAGQYVSFTGLVNAANNNAPAKVASVGGGGSSLTFSGTPFVNEAASAGVKARAIRIVNANTLNTFDIERGNGDITQFECFRGMFPNKLSLDFKTGSVLTGSIDWMGKDALPMSGTTALTGSLTSSLTNTIMNSVNNLSNILEGGAAIATTYVKSLKLNINNNARAIKALGNLGAVAMALGECDVDGEIEVYLSDATLYNKYLNNTLSSLSFTLKDAAGNAYVITLPAIKYQSGDRPSGGKNQDVMVKLGFQAIRDPSTNAHIIIDRCGSAVTLWS